MRSNKCIYFLILPILFFPKIALCSLINFNFQNISTRAALQLLAQSASKNLVMSDDVKGNLSLNLKDVSWNQALSTILISQNLTAYEKDNILFIMPKQQQEKNADSPINLSEKIIFLRYAKADDIAKLIQSKLSDKGSVSADSRTNSILLQDLPNRIIEVSKLIKQLDVAVNQVSIAARIVNIDSDYENELGARFGMSNGHHVSGTYLGANALAQPTPAAQVDPLQRLNVDLPVVNAGAGRIGLALIKLNQGTFIDLELSALEAEGHAKIVSTPELVATNQQPALIQAGQEIPYQEKTSSGATSVAFKKAVLSLKVTPQIIPNGKILLYLQVNQDNRSSKEVLGVPEIDTRAISTQILVNNKQTIALGGIYEETQNNIEQRVPFFASLPVVGNLFRYRKIVKNKRELMIFVTPTILQE